MTDLPVLRHTFFQNSLMSALLDGIYDGEMSVGELLGHGNFGLGTFDGLDGEMIIIDGVCWQLRGDGSATRADMSQRSPYTVVTNFVPHITRETPKAMTRSEVTPFIDSLIPSQNYMYALRITGLFEEVRTRTVVKQEKPYRRMVESTGDDASVDFHDVRGVVAGFRTPIYEKGIGVPGCHVHFIDDDRTGGGHVLDFTLKEGLIEICPGTDLQLHLPLTREFSTADLAPEDLDAQIHATEVKE
ncbi:acetolactate decarboxylase [Corynebacterium sp.]|uniref:acetolactate decarboxylase n=1 Tax=Corynebacterium sp. TaxID=1720 RepID=UPI0026DD45DB|nr:acetolactate decarboxylase [Corynebacterium sp.]MDO4610335.1 acetolactate decarboxylase [Corynebacterium sp.]